jgi:uncharacterized membrane protein
MVTAFLGAPILTAAAAPFYLWDSGRGVLLWVVLALVLHVVTIGITVGVNVPANDRLKAAGDVGDVEAATARAEFDEHRWVRWNLVRVMLSVGGFGALLWSLALAGGLDAA